MPVTHKKLQKNCHIHNYVFLRQKPGIYPYPWTTFFVWFKWTLDSLSGLVHILVHFLVFPWTVKESLLELYNPQHLKNMNNKIAHNIYIKLNIIYRMCYTFVYCLFVCLLFCEFSVGHDFIILSLDYAIVYSYLHQVYFSHFISWKFKVCTYLQLYMYCQFLIWSEINMLKNTNGSTLQ
jgi:hypothetical protein